MPAAGARSGRWKGGQAGAGVYEAAGDVLAQGTAGRGRPAGEPKLDEAPRRAVRQIRPAAAILGSGAASPADPPTTASGRGRRGGGLLGGGWFPRVARGGGRRGGQGGRLFLDSYYLSS